MAISVADNFSYQGTKPLDARVSFDTVSAMAAASDATLYDGCFAYVKAVQKYYSYDSTNTADPTTGKWREYSSGGGGSNDYPDLTNKPSINGVELLGNKVIGLLSGNIHVDSDKIGYDNLTSGLSATNVKDALDELANGGGGESHGIPSGGTSGQALVKASNDDYDATWSDIAISSISNKYDINIATKVKFKSTSTWTTKTWSGQSNFSSIHIWTDGDNIYYSDYTEQYVLDKSTSTWTTKTWNGLTVFYSSSIWTDGDDIYYSSGTKQYVLNKSTSTWTTKKWNGLTKFDGGSIWSDGDNIYYSYVNNQYVLNKSTSTWTTKTWNGLTNFYNTSIWTDGDDIYYSNGTGQYVLDKSTSTWTTKTWNGLINFSASYIWTDGDDIYYSEPASLTDKQYVLNKSTSTWTTKTWNGLTNFTGGSIWSDGDDIYYSNGTGQYVLNKSKSIYS